jgi:hypothetical protein
MGCLLGVRQHANGVQNISPGQAKRRPGVLGFGEKAALKEAAVIADLSSGTGLRRPSMGHPVAAQKPLGFLRLIPMGRRPVRRPAPSVRLTPRSSDQNPCLALSPGPTSSQPSNYSVASAISFSPLPSRPGEQLRPFQALPAARHLSSQVIHTPRTPSSQTVYL